MGTKGFFLKGSAVFLMNSKIKKIIKTSNKTSRLSFEHYRREACTIITKFLSEGAYSLKTGKKWGFETLLYSCMPLSNPNEGIS